MTKGYKSSNFQRHFHLKKHLTFFTPFKIIRGKILFALQKTLPIIVDELHACFYWYFHNLYSVMSSKSLMLSHFCHCPNLQIAASKYYHKSKSLHFFLNPKYIPRQPYQSNTSQFWLDDKKKGSREVRCKLKYIGNTPSQLSHKLKTFPHGHLLV